MKKNLLTLLTAATVAAASAIPAMALFTANRNALSTSIVIKEGFQKPPEELDPKAAEEAAARQKAPMARVSAPDRTPLPQIVATVYDYATNTIGMYRLPELSGGEMEKVSDISSYYGGALSGTTFYACHDGRYDEYWDTDNDPHGHRIQGYDINTWEKVGDEIYLPEYRASDLAIDPKTGTGYAYCDYGAMSYHLYSINLETGFSLDITPGASLFNDELAWALAFDNEGTLYGVTRGGVFGKVNFTTGQVDRISDIGVTNGSARYNWSGAFDPDSGDFILMANGEEEYSGPTFCNLYSINPETGAATLLADFPGKSITSIFIAESPVADNAPGTPSTPTGNFPAGSLSGTICFTMPSTLHDGSAATGEASWKMIDGKETVAEGTAAYGAEVKATVTVAAAGKHNFSVSASNAAGEGKKSRLSMWVGPDIPESPGNVKVDFVENENRFTVTWDAVTTGANGGFVDPSSVTYTVTRMPAGAIVAENISGTQAECIYEPEGIESVVFHVTASQGGNTSAPGVSDPTMTGSLTLPYDLSTLDFYDVFTNWSVFDLNNDGATWGHEYSGIAYKYDYSNAANDWVLTPPVKAVAGCKYKVHVAFTCRMASCPEKVEVKMGYACSPDAMTTELLPVTLIDQTDPMGFDFEMTAEQDGKMFIGFHAVSDPNMYYLTIKELTISAPVSYAAPAAPEILEVTADRSGALKASGKVKVPELAENGTTLTAVSKLEVTRNNQVVATIDAPVPGSTVEFSDETVTENGEYTYTAYAYNGTSKGAPSPAVKTFVGINRSKELTGIEIARNADDPTKVTVTWEAPVSDWLGYPLNGEVTYNVEVFPDNAYYHGNKTYEGITETSLTFTPTFETGRDRGFVYVKVSAVNAAGIGYAEKSANIFAGLPVKAPFKESFPNYSLEHPWGDGASNGPQIASITDDERALQFQQYNGWNRMMDSSFQSAEGSQDHDNGFAGMFGWSYVNDEAGNYHNEWTELLSPAIDLSGMEEPTLTFYTYNWLQQGNPDINELDVDVMTADGTRHNVKHLVIKDLGNVEAWELVAVDMKEFAGQTISLIFKGTIHANDEYGYNWVLIDNIRIEDIAETDLAVTDIKAPVQAKPGETFTVRARVTNLGTSDVQAYKAILLHNDEEVAAKDLGQLMFGAAEFVEFQHSLSVQDPVGNIFRISIEATGDEVADNNISGAVTVARNLPLLPEPEAVFINPDGKQLEWIAPDMAKAVPEAVLEDFESYPCAEEDVFLTEAGDWIFIDVDQLPIGGMVSSSTWEMLDFPGIPIHSAQSWWVQSRMYSEFSDGYYGYDNSLQYLANMYVVNSTFTRGEQQDDWAIAPELCGREQLVTLWARSYNRETPETVEFLYSEGGTNPEDFTLVRRIEELPGDWTQYAVVVPEGARRFAIRGCSYAPMGTSQIFIDNVSFYPATGAPQDLTLKGYNIYCGNTLLNAEPVESLRFSDLPSEEETGKEYAVSAVYANGESRAVKAVEGTGIGSNHSMAPAVTAGKGVISINGMSGQNYNITSTSGITVASGEGKNHIDIPVSQGVYIVSISGNATKVIVK